MNRVTAISGCGCGADPPPLAPNTAPSSAAPSSYPSWGWAAVLGGAVVGAVGTSLATGTAFKAKGKNGMVLGLGAVAGAGAGYLIARYGG